MIEPPADGWTGPGHSGRDDLDWSPFDLPFSDPRHPFHVAHMEMALEEAALAAAEDEVPVGAVIVSAQHGVIARAHNQRERRVLSSRHFVKDAGNRF